MNAASATIDERRGYFCWLFSPPTEPATLKETIAWWERRRLPYNVFVGATALVCFPIYYISIVTAGVLKPGEDVVEPIALMAAPLAVVFVNICYTLGWFVDAPLRFLKPTLDSRFTLWLFILGIAFSAFVVSLPAVFWGGYRLLQLIGALR